MQSHWKTGACLCKMTSKVLLVWCVLSEICSTEGNFLYINSAKLFNDAEEDCNNRGLELLTMSTYLQYLDALSYFSLPSSPTVSWLGLGFNTTTGNYQWLNGRVLTELKWEVGEPKNTIGTDCGVMDVSSTQWYTRPCTDSRHYLCVGSDGSYSASSASGDFYTAVHYCRSEGRRLPVAITNLDTNWLNDVINTTSISHDIWLGLIRSGTQYGDYFRWVTGEHLTPPYAWANNVRYATVFYFYKHLGKKEKLSSCWGCYGSYVCQTKYTENAAQFVLVSNNSKVLGSIRKTTTINPLRRFPCALECIRDAGCIQYTIQDYMCRTFGEIVLITEYSGGSTVWQRKQIL